MFHQQPVTWCFTFIGIGLLGLLGSMVPLMSDAEESIGLHLLYVLRGPEKTPDNVAIVAIDEESAKALNLPLAPYKWPRRLHSQLVEKLSEDHAEVIAFDMIFYEAQDVSNDQTFAAAIRQAGNVVLTQSIDRKTMPVFDQRDDRTVQLNIERLISATPVLADAAVAQAPFPLPTVPVQLNQFWCFRPGSANVPTLPIVAFHIFTQSVFADFIGILGSVDDRLAQSLPVSELTQYDIREIVELAQPLHKLFERKPSLASKAIEKLEKDPPTKLSDESRSLVRSLVNLYKRGNASYLNLYGPPGTIRTIPYHRLLTRTDKGPDDEDFSLVPGSAVFVGQTMSDWLKTHDSFYTVFSEETGQHISGVEIAATAFANLLENKTVHPLRGFSRLLLILGWGLLVVSISFFFSIPFAVLGLLFVNSLYLYAITFQFAATGLWNPVVAPIFVQTPTAFIVCVVCKYRRAKVEREHIRKAFGHYLPDTVVDRVSASTKALRLGGKVFYGVCLFTDAQNYTTLSERMNPDNLARLMNHYYDAIFGPIQSNEGLVLQVVGDAVMALWSSPEPKQELKHAACKAAVEISASVDRFNKKAGPFAMPTRIGIHAGDMHLGNIGTVNHFEYRPVGDIVNTASRLEGLNKHLGTQMLVSEEAIGWDEGFLSRAVGHFVFKGKSNPVTVHELYLPKNVTPEQQVALLRTFDVGLKAFKNRHWDLAVESFKKVLEIDAGDGPSLFYLEQCKKLETASPGIQWMGEVHLQSK